MEALGRLFDIGLAFAPVDTQTAAITSKRLWMGDCEGVTFLCIKAAGTANDDPVFTVNQHTAYTSGTTAVLTTVTRFHYKQEAVLDNDEPWVLVTQAAGSTVTGNATSAETQMLIVIEVDAAEMGDGYTHISVDLADTGSAGAQLGAGIYIKHGLRYPRKPTNLGNLLNPGAANA